MTMKEQKFRRHIVEAGKALLDMGLVARTWGNVSARMDEDSFLITPSGLDYNTMEEEDIVLMDLYGDDWSGKHKPSGEKGVHKAAYQTYEHVNFVIHTHQTYATAIGLAGFDELDISDEEIERLGGLALAGYGLSGTAKLTGVVKEALENGAEVVLMAHHGALICGKDIDDALEKAELLEEICQRNCRGQQSFEVPQRIINGGRKLAESLKEEYGFADVLATHQAVLVSQAGKDLAAQIDDMAQMVGRRAKAATDISAVRAAMKHNNAVLAAGLGIAVKAENQDDLDALMILMQKASIVKLHTDACKEKGRLGAMESALMHFVYKKKYSKQKDRKDR